MASACRRLASLSMYEEMESIPFCLEWNICTLRKFPLNQVRPRIERILACSPCIESNPHYALVLLCENFLKVQMFHSRQKGMDSISSYMERLASCLQAEADPFPYQYINLLKVH